MPGRKHRCPNHPAVMKHWDETCPLCQIEDLERKIQMLTQAATQLGGEPVGLAVGYPAHSVLEPLLKRFALASNLPTYGGGRPEKTLRLGIQGNGNNHDRYYVLPARFAEALVEVWAKCVEELVELGVKTAQDAAEEVHGHLLKQLQRELLPEESYAEATAKAKSEMLRWLAKKTEEKTEDD